MSRVIPVSRLGLNRVVAWMGALVLGSAFLVPTAATAAQANRRSHMDTPITAYASVGAALFKSTALESTWNAAGTLSASSLAVGGSTRWRDVFAAGHDGVYTSHDGGGTWVVGLHARAYAVAASTHALGTILAGTGSGLSRSTDDGTSWSAVLSTHGSVIATQTAGNASPICYAATAAGRIYESDDDGATWSPYTGPLPGRRVLLHMAVDPSDPSAVYVATASGIWRADATGWTESTTGGMARDTYDGIDVDNSTLYAVTSDDHTLYISHDHGLTWDHTAIPGLYGRVTALADDGDQSGTLAVGDTNGTVRYTTDGGATWIGSGGTIAGTVGTPVVALALGRRPTLPVDGVTDPHGASALFVAANGGHTVRGPFLAPYEAHGAVLGAPMTEQFSDPAHGNASAQCFENMELMVQGSEVVPAPLGWEQRPAGYGDKTYGVDPRFRTFWSSHGGAGFLGPPVTPLLHLSNGDGSGNLYPMQYFRNARLEYHPELGAVEVSRLGEQALQNLGWL